jgi:hypothetical protein
MRPLNNRIIAAASPIMAPPASAFSQTSGSIKMLIAEPFSLAFLWISLD